MTMTEFTTTVEGSADEVRIHCMGDLNVRADEAMAAAYEEAAAFGASRITLEFEDVGYINSTGIALIVRLLTSARADGRAVRAVGLTAHYRHLFEITRLSDYMEILDDAPIGAATNPGGEGA